MKTLYYAGQPDDGYGWGTCNTNLIRELGKLCNVFLGDEPIPFKPLFDGTVFMPTADHDLNPISPARGKRNLAYTFFEYPLGSKAQENSKLYDLIFCGSTWCKERLAERGIHNTKVLIQGVDHEIFCPRKTERFVRTNGSESITGVDFKIDPSFRIFSGGKFEYRKGQDIVIAAFKEFVKTHPEAHLVCAWFNPWPTIVIQSLQQMELNTPRGDIALTYGQQDEFYKRLLVENGIPEANFTVLPQLSQSALADVMRSTDIGVFPNRCEGGTNLVLMEYMSCGKAAIVSDGTGHSDIANCQNAMLKYSPAPRNAWREIAPRDIIAQMIACFHDSKLRAAVGTAAAVSMKQWTWERAARTILGEV